jgi:histidine ammonia-lyase
MGASAARHARTVLGHVQQIVAIELLAAAQALDLRLASLTAGGLEAPQPGAGVAEAHERIRERVTHLVEDREPGPDLATTLAIVQEGALVDLVGD